MASQDPIEAIRAGARPLNGGPGDYDELLDLVGNARFVLLGEATHGTHEFYEERARITRRLIEEKGFHAVAVEADWPDAYRVNRYVRGQDGDTNADEALSGFQRFPNWMWRNTDVAAFVEWLRRHNQKQNGGRQVGFYGLDLYSLFTSMQEVLAYLDQVDPNAAQIARERYACFDHYYEDSQHYGYSASLDLEASCEQGVIEQLNQLQRRAHEYSQKDGSEDAFFHAQQNARLVKNAEEYYRTMFRGRVSSWNLRDSHMAETLDALAGHLTKDGEPAKIVVWEHNSRHRGRPAGRVERGRTRAQGLRRRYPPDRLFDLRRFRYRRLRMGRAGRAQAGASGHAGQLRGVAAPDRHRALPAASQREKCGR
jgi:erythromycin esterase-like protein